MGSIEFDPKSANTRYATQSVNCLTLEDRSDRSSRNVGKKLPSYTAQNSKRKPFSFTTPRKPEFGEQRRPVAYPGILFGGGGVSTNSVEDRGQRERGSGVGSPLVRSSGGSCNLV